MHVQETGLIPITLTDVDIFNEKIIRKPEAKLFYSRQDPNDPRLGEQVWRSFADYGLAQVVLIGCPQDEGVRRNGGRPGAALAPTEIRRALYRMTVNGIENLRVLDLGDLVPQATLEQTHALQQQWVQRLLEDGKRVVVLGGGNDISYPDASALALVAPKMLAFNIDAHFDVRADQPCNSGTPYRQLLEEGYLKPELFFEMAYQPFANSPVYARYLRDKGVSTVSLSGLREQGVAATFKKVLKKKNFDVIFWGFDLDAVRASDAPGVSAPNPTGLTGEELCDLATLAGADERTRVIEFSEVSPAFDVDQRTSRLTAAAIWHYLAALAPSL